MCVIRKQMSASCGFVLRMEEMNMKRMLALVLALCMVLSLCACGASNSGSQEKVIKIGVFEPSSGDSASGGKKEILGMQYANSQVPEITLGGETYKIELVYGDNGSSTDKAPSAASSLVSAGVSVVLGSYGSGVSMAGGPKFEEAGIPAIGVTCTNPTSPQATATTSVFASWITSRLTSWPTSPWISSTPRSLTAWARAATSTTRA